MKFSHEKLGSKDIPVILLLIAIILVRDVWAIAKASYCWLKPRAIAWAIVMLERAIVTNTKLCSLVCQMLDDESEEPSIWQCLDALTCCIVEDYAWGVEWLGNLILKRLTSICSETMMLGS